MGAQAKALTDDIRKAVSKRFPQITLWRIEPNKGQREINGRKFWANSGTDGLPDLVGLIAPSGKFIGVEIKAGKDQMRPAQYGIQALVGKAGGIYLVARSVDGLLADLAEAV